MHVGEPFVAAHKRHIVSGRGDAIKRPRAGQWTKIHQLNFWSRLVRLAATVEETISTVRNNSYRQSGTG
jgi:hypothetical protein